MSDLPTTAARTAALSAHGKHPCAVLELTVDRCSNVYGSAPCTAAGAAGSECYNTFSTCQDKTNYSKAAQTIKFVSRGVMSPPGESLRPYLLSSITAPTKLDFEAGLAARNVVSLSLADETDNDSSQDPYFATRATPAGGTYWTRWIARNKNYVGRLAKMRRGFVADTWNWDLFLDELYTIDQIGIENNGQINIVLKDPLKIADNTKYPLPTDGALQAELKNVEQTGYAAAGGASTITLNADASAVDSYYNGMEVYLFAGTGAGQRRVVSSYVGGTRVATLSSAWSVTPNTTSAYQVSGLSVTLDAGKGAQYADPATSGKAEYIRIGGEIIRYTAKSTDTLSWPDATYRAQFGSVRDDHSASDAAQLCRAFIDQSISNVITDMLTESGIDAGYLSADIASECAIWYGAGYNITAIISEPDTASKLVAELLTQIDAVMWWSPQTQKVEFKALVPNVAAYPSWTDEANIVQGSMSVKSLDTLRITQAAMRYAIKDAAGSITEPRNFMRTDVAVNTDAQSTNEYNDVRPKVVNTRWFGAANVSAMRTIANRRIARLYDAPKQFTLKIDHKDYTMPIGSMVEIQSHKHLDVAGQPKAELCFVTSMDDKATHVEVQARSTNFSTRYGFIAPAGTADYPTETIHAHIALSTGKMSNGDNGYRII